MRFNDAIANEPVDPITGVHVHRQDCFELLVFICEERLMRSTAIPLPTRCQEFSHLEHDVLDLTIQLFDIDLHR